MTLANLPSKLIRQGLEDLGKCQVDPVYEIVMGSWHFKIPNGVCQVCLAGAVMAQSLSRGYEDTLTPGSFKIAIEGKLVALSSFRKGNVRAGCLTMQIRGPAFKVPKAVPDKFTVTPYAEDKGQWTLDMLNMAEVLEGLGL